MPSLVGSEMCIRDSYTLGEKSKRAIKAILSTYGLQLGVAFTEGTKQFLAYEEVVKVHPEFEVRNSSITAAREDDAPLSPSDLGLDPQQILEDAIRNFRALTEFCDSKADKEALTRRFQLEANATIA